MPPFRWSVLLNRFWISWDSALVSTLHYLLASYSKLAPLLRLIMLHFVIILTLNNLSHYSHAQEQGKRGPGRPHGEIAEHDARLLQILRSRRRQEIRQHHPARYARIYPDL